MKWFEECIKEKNLIYCNDYRDGNATNEEIMKATVLGEYFEKFNAEDFKGAEHIKNDEKIFFSNIENKVWQICGRASDMTGFIIPNTYLVREIGIWGEAKEDLIKTYIGRMSFFDGLTDGKQYRITKERDNQYFIPMNDLGGTSWISKDKFE